MHKKFKHFLLLACCCITIAVAGQTTATVSGKVLSEMGEGLASTTITVQDAVSGQKRSLASGADGIFSIGEFQVGHKYHLFFEHIGYIPDSVMNYSLSAGENSSLLIRLKLLKNTMNEVVVVGYGTQRKSDLTGSVTSIGSKDFIKGVATDALQLISGKAAGVEVSQANAEPGGNLNIRIRGVGSINSSNTALMVIDGVPVESTSNLNPADIKSVEVLKDASAAAIYGTRAANGVVLITTKKGEGGPLRIAYNTYWAYQTPAAKLRVLNATQYMQYLNDINKDLGQQLPFTNEQIAQAGAGTNWQDQLFRNAWASNHQVSVSGGSNQVKYYTSLRYLNQDGILISSGIKQYNALANLEVTPNDKFKFGISINGSVNVKDKIANESNSGGENADPLNAAIQFDPSISPDKNVDGRYDVNPTIALDNPVALAYGYDYRERNNRTYGNSYAEYEVLNGLKARVRLGGDLFNTRNDNYTGRITQKGLASGGIGEISSSTQTYWLSEWTLNYDRRFGVHHFSALGGATWEKFLTTTQYSYATGFLSDITNTDLLQSGNATSARVASSKTSRALQSLFGRLNYTLKDKYLFTATLRRDGTSRFSDKNKYALFPSVALGWRIIQESFMDPVSVLNDLKLRLSYGQMGNEGIGNFATIPTYIAGGNTVLGGQIVNGAQPARLPNPDLKWETTEEYNLGLDFALLKNRISGSVEYYIKNTFDQLFNKPVARTTGFSTILTNFGNVRNKGLDVTLNSVNIAGPFRWTTDVTFATLNNKVTELPPYIGEIISGGIIANIPGFSLVKEGYPMYALYGYSVTGIFQQGEDIKSSAQPDAKPGWPKFLDKDNNGVINASDRVVLGTPYPKYSFSFNNTFSYKNFTLNIYWLGVNGIKTFNGNIVEAMYPINLNRNIMSKFYVERWTPERAGAAYPSGVNYAVYFGNGKMINSYSIQDASYLRLKNINLSYNIPMMHSRVFKSVVLTLTGDNLLTFTKFEGYDPAANQTGDGSSIAKSSYNNYPLARVFSIGANITF
ncbi:SusC/RagA family TonB-linked outer membrane protein [Niabella hirudinis]|uniref:SusC/RagA family TonB-linked outer membrane protein n=1 Tax=Niabella hirudinis TaxID=1285929 RepID=UPI003EB96DD1